MTPRKFRDTGGTGWLWDELPDGRVQSRNSERFAIAGLIPEPIVRTIAEVNADPAIRPLVEVDDDYQPKRPP